MPANICAMRIPNEIKELIIERKYKKVIFVYDEYGNDMVMKIHKRNGNIIKICVSDQYPFRMPIVYINDELYRCSLIITSNKIKFYYDNPCDFYIDDIFKKSGKNNNCLCCVSLTCPNIWTSIMSIKQILAEIEETNQLKHTIQMKLLLNDIVKKYGLPQDLIRTLYQYLL